MSSTPSPQKVAILRDRLFVPGEFVTESMLEQYRHQILVGEDPHTREKIYDTINHYQLSYLSQDKLIYSFNRGDLDKMYRIFSDFTIVDERISVPMKNKLKIQFKNGKSWRDYQPEAIEAMLAKDYGILKAPPRSGKPVWVENLITMGDGSLKKLKEIKVGDFVITHEGRPREVLEIFEQPKQKCLKLKTQSKIETVTAIDHPYLTPEGFIQAQDLKPGMYLVHTAFDVAESLRKDEEFLLAGFFVGDGTTLHNQATISTKDEKRITEILNCCSALGFSTNIYRSQSRVPKIGVSTGVLNWLREGDMADKGAWDKYVPSWVFKASNRQIALFLSAYFACDGTVSKRGRTRSRKMRSDTCIEIYSVSLQLLQDCQKLFSRLGIKTSVNSKKGKYKKEDHFSWRLAFSQQDDVVKFRNLAYDCGEKTTKLKEVNGYRNQCDSKHWTDELISIETVEDADCRCLTVDEDHTFISDDFIVHNTLMITACICMEREKTLVFAHQTDLLVQLYDTIMEFTNLADLQTKSNPVVGFATTVADFDNLDIVLCTKQTFDHAANKMMLPAIQKMFGAIITDESHYVNADIYSRLINRFHAKTRRGVTATPNRKDGLQIIVEGIIGPVIHEITGQQVQQVPMEVIRVNTNVNLKIRTFSKILKVLIENESRNKLIVDNMVADVRKGHTIIAVTDRKEHQTTLKSMLAKHDIEAEIFNGNVTNKNSRKILLNKIRSREVPIMISMRNMTTGLDIPRADVFYNLLPSSNVVAEGEFAGEGGYEQQCTRVRTPFEGKKKCYVKDFVDAFGMSYACWNSRKKTYDKIGAVIRANKQDLPVNLSFPMDGGFWSGYDTEA